jgi:signal transduction histidine kinase
MNNKNSYTLFGIAFGLCFPVISILIEGLLIQNLDLGWAMIAQVHKLNPLMYVIDSAPLFLGLAFGIAGKYLDQAQQKSLRKLSADKSLRLMRRLRIVYIGVILIIGAMLTIGLLTLRSYQIQQEAGGNLIANAGKQRLLAQKLSKEMLLVAYCQLDTKQQKMAAFEQTLATFETSGNTLRQDLQDLQKKQRDVFQNLPDSLERYLSQMQTLAYTFLREQRTLHQPDSVPTQLASMQDFLEIESRFYPFINKIVYKEIVWLNDALQFSRNLGLTVFFAILIGLLVSGFAIFRPTINRAEKAIINYVLINQKQEQVNEELQQSQEELLRNLEQLAQAQQDLQTQKLNLERALTDLQNSQAQLVHSEKMSTLGQLVASIAHEINNPIAAIRSSAQATAATMQNFLPQLAEFLKKLTQEDYELFLTCYQVRPNLLLSSRERRNLKYDLMDTLEAQTIENAQDLADLLTELNLTDKQLIDRILALPNPLLFIQKIKQYRDLEESSHNITLATEKAAKIIFALKNFARQDHTGKKQLADINESIDITLTLYQNQIKQGVEVVRELEELPMLPCFIDELTQVWTNLIHNALQAMDNSGKLLVRSQKTGDAILVSVTDTGAGIPTEVQDKIFNPFFTTKKGGEGSGLGLDISKKIVDKHDGKLWFETQEGVGTTFFVSLPLSTDDVLVS